MILFAKLEPGCPNYFAEITSMLRRKSLAGLAYEYQPIYKTI